MYISQNLISLTYYQTYLLIQISEKSGWFKKEPVKKESVKKEPVKKEPVKKEPVKKELISSFKKERFHKRASPLCSIKFYLQ